MERRMIVRACALVAWSSLAIGAGCGDNLTPRETSTPDAAASPDAPAPDAAAPDPTHIAIADGEVRGSIVGTSRQFLAIPYAKPPIGDLRWKAPQKPDAWTAPRDATQFSKRCAQLANPTLQNAASTDEDCLYLNVWTPSPAPNGVLPVMIWIHGGGNVNGSTSEPVPFVNTGVFYSGQFLAGNHNVVVVSMNYRLGLFGFFAHPALAAEGSSGNQGLLDQRMAMQWVHDNIRKFGGDPDNVTIFGESAGSQDVCLHVASPGSAPLFHRAISESGGCTTRLRTQTEAEAQATAVASDLACPGADALACLRGKSAAELMAARAVVDRLNNGGATGFGPNIDGQFMPDQPRTLYNDGHIARVPYLLGSNQDEGTLFVATAPIATEGEYADALTARFGPTLGGAVKAAYKFTDFTNDPPNAALAALARVIGDSLLVCTTYDTAVRAQAAGLPVYLYNFNVPVPPQPGIYLGATHGSELTSVFGTSPVFTTETQLVSDVIQNYWTNFARTGDPNPQIGIDPMWPKLTATQNIRLNFALEPTSVPSTVLNFRADLCNFWSTVVYNAQFPAPP